MLGARILQCSRALVCGPVQSLLSYNLYKTSCSIFAKGIPSAAKVNVIPGPCGVRFMARKKRDELDGIEDPYLEHRQNIEKAKAHIDEHLKPNMTEDEVNELIEQAYNQNIPEPPHWSQVDKYYDDLVAKAKQERVRRIVEKAAAYAARRRKRKTSVARVWVTEGNGTVVVNKTNMVDYFGRLALREEIYQPLQVTGKPLSFNVWCTVKGGGLTGQAGAVKLGVARALQAFGFRKDLKKFKLLTQDDRQVERKKPGREKARRSFQWVKR